MENKPMFKAGDKVLVWHSGLQRKVNATLKRQDNDGGVVVTLETGGDRWVLNSQVEAVPAPYATYDGGEAQYRADLATLQEAGMLIAGKLDNAWVLGDMSEIKLMRYSHDLMRALPRFMPYAIARLGGAS